MERSLAAFAASGAPLPERLEVARELALAVARLHARGRVHGALSPERALVAARGVVVLAPPPADPEPPLARAGFDAPEVARGARPTARSDVFAAGALAWLALAGRSPFDAPEPLERVRRALFVEAEPVRFAVPGVPAEVEAAIASALEKRARRRSGIEALAEALTAATAGAAETATSTATATATPTPTPTPTPTATSTPIPTATAFSPPVAAVGEGIALEAPPAPLALLAAARHKLPTFVRSASSAARTAARRAGPTLRALAAAAWHLAAAAALALASALRLASTALRRLPPAMRVGLAAAAAVALVWALLPESDAVLEREVAALVGRGDYAAARQRLDASARERPGDPVVEKLRGDLACARGEPAECIRRYRVAIAKRPDLRDDRVLRANARRLLRPAQSCGTRRAAATLVGELHDRDALPALEEARRSGGVFAWFCTGDSFDRAITATRADLRR